MRRAAPLLRFLALLLTLAPAAPAAGAERAGPPEWARAGVMYGAVVERFGPRGDFDSLRHRLDRLDRLGVDAIWLSPVNATLPDDFGYAVTGYRRLRPSYGSKADFRRLVGAIHQRGMRVLMDLVPNHTSRQHRWFQTARRTGPSGDLWDFYERDREGRARHYFDWDGLPNLNYANPEVRRRMLAISSYWVRHFGIDGYRVDVAWGVRRRAPSFWPRWSRRLRSIDPDVYLLAEASARRGWYARNGFDATYDWTGRLGEGAWQRAFDRRARVGPRLRRALGRTPAGPAGSQVLRFLENNDTGRRFADRHGVALTRVASTLELTVPGMPLIYTGQEVGASFDPYSLAEPVDLRDRRGLFAHYRRLIALRHELPALGGRRLRIVSRGPGSTFAFVRPGEQPVLVVLNFARGARTVRLPASDALRPFAAAGSLTDLLGGATLPALAAERMRMPANGARILVPSP